MAKIVGLDVGYGFVKATDGETGFSFPSVVGEGHTNPTFRLKSVQTPILDDLKIAIGNNLYFIGKAAIRHSNFAYRDLSYTRTIGNDLELLFLTALSLFYNNKSREFKVVTGLPVDRMHLAEELEGRLLGEKTIKIPRRGVIQDTKTFYISEVEIVPQPLGTYWSQFLDGDKEGTTYLPKGLIGIIDIGFRTTDLAAIDNGEYIPGNSKSFPTGLVTAYREIGVALAREYGLEKESYALDSAVINRKINISGQTVDISAIVEEAFEKLATNILVEINSQWRIQDLDRLIVTGGGGQAISSYLLRQLPQAELAAEPNIANCSGFLAWGNWLWRVSGVDLEKEPVENE
ncbi:MAG: ParM/StbA family protein [bacterium]